MDDHRKKPGFLRRIWKNAASGVIALPFLASAFMMAVESPATRLTGNEKELLESIFGDQLDTDAIRMHRNERNLMMPGNAGNVYFVPFRASHIYLWEHSYSEDYSETDPSLNSSFNYGLFIHEATHVWQGQNWWSAKPFMCKTDNTGDKYYYVLRPGKKFTEYCTEQQAAMVEHYARYFLHPTHVSPWIYSMKGSMLALRDVVEAQFPQARLTRENLEKKSGLPPFVPKV